MYELVIESYVELENAMLSVATRYIVRPHSTIDDMDDVRRLFNLRVMQLMTIARTYIECAPKAISRILPTDETRGAATLKKLFSVEYDHRLGYRVMEALRNSAQHSGLPLNSLTMGGRWKGQNKKRKGRLEYYALTTLDTETLKTDRNFKKKILTELDLLGKKHDLRPFMRDYLEGLSSAHGKMRLTLETNIGLARDLVHDAIEQWKTKANTTKHPSGLILADTAEVGTYDIIRYISTRPLESLKKLGRRNENLVNLNLSHVSNDAEDGI
ncbi:MAG: hypothetical protein ACKVP7_21505 [Hyphomicrobiaceae bacterium]